MPSKPPAEAVADGPSSVRPGLLQGMSLRRRLLVLLLPLMLLTTGVELWSAQREALAAANSAYDRSIRGALKAIEANISTASGGLAVELPYRLFELLELTATGHVYFRVATVDGLVEVGNLDLPAPRMASLRPQQPVFGDAIYLGERVRMGALLTQVSLQGAEGPVTPVLIQVAEQARSREQFADQFVRTSLLRGGVVLAILLGSLVLVVTWGLKPLQRLEAEVRRRRASDLSPLETADLPRDVRPLVQAVNLQMVRRQALADQQRQFLDDASHQLRTPLTTLRTQADYALRVATDGAVPQEVTQSLQAMVDQIDVATRSTNQMLSLARSEAVEPHWQRFDLAETVRSTVTPLLRRARQRDLDLGVEAPDALWVRGDQTLLREALLNLLDNALRYAHPASAVTARAAVEQGMDGPAWVIQVTSRGDPAPDALRAHWARRGLAVDAGMQPLPAVDDAPAEGRFVRGVGAQQGGAGLGLDIAARIARRHGGRLHIDAQPAGVFVVTMRWAATDDRPVAG